MLPSFDIRRRVFAPAGAYLSFLEKKGSKEKPGKTVFMAIYTASIAAERVDSPARRAQTGGTWPLLSRPTGGDAEAVAGPATRCPLQAKGRVVEHLRRGLLMARADVSASPPVGKHPCCECRLSEPAGRASQSPPS